VRRGTRPRRWELQRWLARVRGGADAGITMLEVTVTMAIMGVVMSIFTTAIVGVFRSSGRTDTQSTAQSQINIAFLRLDKEIRYASAIVEPAQFSDGWYVEYLTTNATDPLCTELRLDTATGQLSRRGWTETTQSPVTAVAGTVTDWVPLVSGVSTATTTPFAFHAADSTQNYQRLTLDLTIGTGSSPSTSRHTKVTFTALNTSLSTKNPNACTELRPTS